MLFWFFVLLFLLLMCEMYILVQDYRMYILHRQSLSDFHRFKVRRVSFGLMKQIFKDCEVVTKSDDFVYGLKDKQTGVRYFITRDEITEIHSEYYQIRFICKSFSDYRKTMQYVENNF